MAHLARAALAAAAVALFAVPAGAPAATVRVTALSSDNTEECRLASDCAIDHSVEYVAGKGERNTLVVTQPGFRFHDDGATIHPGRGCRRVNSHEAVCPKPRQLVYVYVDTAGGRDDVTLDMKT